MFLESHVCLHFTHILRVTSVIPYKSIQSNRIIYIKRYVIVYVIVNIDLSSKIDLYNLQVYLLLTETEVN